MVKQAAPSFDADLNRKVIAGVDCPKCKSKKGEKCTTYNGRKLHRAHVDRYELFAATRQKAITTATSVGDLPPGEYTIKDDTIVTGDGTTPQWTEKQNTTAAVTEPNHTPLARAIVQVATGATVEEVEARQRNIHNIRGGLNILVTINGLDWTLNRIAQMIVDGEDWYPSRGNN